MRYLRNTCTDPYFNMAFDEYALEQLPLDEPLFYLWQNKPAVIIGLNQDAYAEVDMNYLRANGIALVRRVTGGGAVFHDLGNLNYTIVGRSTDLNRDYPDYARHVLHALQALGVDAELSGRNDILVCGRKVSGYAKRVYKDRLMVHGTLMYDVDLTTLEQVLNPPPEKLAIKGVASVRSRVVNLCKYLPKVKSIDDLRMRLEEHLSRGYRDSEVLLLDEQLQAIARMAHKKFATEDWNYRHSVPQGVDTTPMVRRGRLACGIVEVVLQVSDHSIVACRFGGDFIGDLSPVALEKALVGVSYERKSILECLAAMDVGRYFDGVQSNELLPLIVDR